MDRGMGGVAHVTVRPGDKVGGYTGERSEVAIMLDAAGAQINEDLSDGTTQYLAMSIFVPKGWTSPTPDTDSKATWGIPLQLHGPDEWPASPPIALSLTDKFGLSLNGGNVDALGGFHAVTYPLNDSGLNLGAWTDFVIKIGFAVDKTGSVEIFRRNKPGDPWDVVLNLQNVATMLTSNTPPTGHHYWKQGFYRSASPAVTNELYLTGLVRAPSFEAAVVGAFGS